MVQHSAVLRTEARLLLGMLVACAADAQSPAAFGKGIAAPGAKLTLLADGFKFTEGPAADKQGNVFFTDQPNNRIMEWSIDGKLSTFMSPSGRSNGMYFDRSGKLYACADLNNQLWEVDPATKKVTVLVKDYQGKKLNGTMFGFGRMAEFTSLTRSINAITGRAVEWSSLANMSIT